MPVDQYVCHYHQWLSHQTRDKKNDRIVPLNIPIILAGGDLGVTGGTDLFYSELPI